jgi:hypothetical protein
MNSLQLHRDLLQAFRQLGLKSAQPQQVNLALLCQALATCPNCHLATLALGLPLPGHRENLVQRLRRFLKTQGDIVASYEPWLRHVLTHWPYHELALVMDRTDIEDRWSILTLGACYHHRLLPLAWDVFSFGSTSAEEQLTLMRRVQAALPTDPRHRITFFGDCEFRAVPVQQTCQTWGWHWHVGLKSDLSIRLADGTWQALREMALQRGQRRYLNQVYLTREHAFGPVNLVADWAVAQDTPRYWALDLPADRLAWRRGRKRYWIEPTHRDWKSYGFDLERSQLDKAARLNVLMLGINITTVWMIHLGTRLLQRGRGNPLMLPHKRDYGVFRLGRDYVLHQILHQQRLPVGFTPLPTV